MSHPGGAESADRVAQDAAGRWRWWTMAWIMVLAACLQFWDLGHKSFWVDEAATVSVASRPLGKPLIAALERLERQPPLHYLYLHPFVRGKDTGDFRARAPFAFLSVVSVGLAAFLAFGFGGWRTCVMTGYLMAISPMLLLFGRMARYYSLLLVLGLASTLAFVRAVDRERRRIPGGRCWILYALTSAGVLLTSYSGVVLIASQTIFGLWVLKSVVSTDDSAFGRENGGGKVEPNRPSPRRLVSGRFHPVLRLTSAVLLAFASLGAWMIWQWNRVQTFSAGPRSLDLQGWKRILPELAYPVYSFALGGTLFPWRPAAILAIAALAFTLPTGARSSGAEGPWKWFAAFITGTGLLLMVLVFQVAGDLPFVTLPSRSMFLVPFFILVLASGLNGMGKIMRVLCLGALTLASVAAGANYFAGREFHNAVYAVPVKEIAQRIQANSEPQDLILADSDIVLDRYLRKGRLDFLDPPRLSAVRSEVKKGQDVRIWSVRFNRDASSGHFPEEDRIERWLSRNLVLVHSRGYGPQDPAFTRIKARFQGLTPYRYKVMVRLYAEDG